jgi:hypothetical protein
MIRRAALFALLVAACGGGANAEPPKVAKYVPPPAEPLLPGWVPVEGPGFVAAMPEGFQHPQEGVFRGERGGARYAIAWERPPGGSGDLDANAVFTRRTSPQAATGCRAVRVRRDDTLEHKTATVDLECVRGFGLAQIHVHGNDVVELTAMVSDTKGIDEDEMRGFFRAFRLKSQ